MCICFWYFGYLMELACLWFACCMCNFFSGFCSCHSSPMTVTTAVKLSTCDWWSDDTYPGVNTRNTRRHWRARLKSWRLVVKTTREDRRILRKHCIQTRHWNKVQCRRWRNHILVWIRNARLILKYAESRRSTVICKTACACLPS